MELLTVELLLEDLLLLVVELLLELVELVLELLVPLLLDEVTAAAAAAAR